MTAQLPITTDAQRIKLTARDFWLLADNGAFEGFAKTELLEGEIWAVNSVWAWHARTTAYFTVELSLALRMSGSDLVVYTCGSVDLSGDSVPEPDVSVGENFDGRGIPLAKVRLAVEVCDTTETNDLRRKPKLYAAAGIPEYWIVHRDSRRVIKMWSPTPDGYAQSNHTAFGDPVGSAILPEVTIGTIGL